VKFFIEYILSLTKMNKVIDQYLNAIEKTLTQEQKDWLDNFTEGTWWVNPSTGLVDVNGDFHFSGYKFKNLMGVRFGRVSGNFLCQFTQLTSLKGSPEEVGGNFDCADNNLFSLEGAPQKVGKSFFCSDNQLTSLEGAPQKVGGSFFCYGNKLTSLEGSPQEVGGNFSCMHNKLTSLEGAPQKVEGNFSCYDNRLTSLKGIPFFRGTIDLKTNPIWDLISPYWKKIECMETGSMNLVLQMIGQLYKPTTEDLKRIERSVYRMEML
jgi:hypothetical protein